MGWWMVVYWIATLVLSEVLRPKIEVHDAAATSAEDVNMPTASSVKPIAVVFGKCRLRDPNVVWYGDYLAAPIKQRAGKGGFLGTGHTIWQIVGYKYHFGLHLGLCHGPVTLHKLWSEEREIWSGTSTGGEILVDQENLYGGQEQGGGIVAGINFLPGNETQVADPYLTSQLGEVPAYRGVASLVWRGPSAAPLQSLVQVPVPERGSDDPNETTWVWVLQWLTLNKTSGYIGTSPTPRPISAEVSRYPAQLTPAESKIGDDANPIECIYECLTTDPNGPDGWGMGLSESLIDKPSFIAAAHQCYLEGLGVSFSWSEQTPIEDVIKQICKTVDAACFRDYRTGKWVIKLMRGGYNVETLPVLDVSDILEATQYSQSSYEGTVNEVKVNYTDRSQSYKSMPAQAQDFANMRMQGEVISSTLSMSMITTASLAERIANRELLATSSALAKADLIINRRNYNFSPGDLFVLNYEPLGISGMVVRVMKSAIGMPNSNRMRVSVIQDIFKLGTATFMTSGGSLWTDPVPAPIPVTTQKVFEVPYHYNTDSLQAAYMVCVQKPNPGSASFEVWEKLQSYSVYGFQDASTGFCPSSTLASAYQSKQVVDTEGLVLNNHADLGVLAWASGDEIAEGSNLAVFETGEIIAFTSATRNLDGTVTLTGILGGLLDTVPSYHAAGERLWFFSYGVSSPEVKVAQTAAIHVKALPSGPRGAITLDQASAMSATMTGRNLNPYPPGKMRVNDLPNPVSIVGSAAATWAHRNKTLQSTILTQDADSVASAEGSYTVQVVVGGTVRRTYEGIAGTGLGNRASGGPGIHYGICARSNGEVFLTSSYLVIGSTAGTAPHCVYKVEASGLSVYHGSVGEYGFVNGSPSASRYHWPQQMSVDSAGNLYFSDQLHVVRRIKASDNTSETFIDLSSYYANPDHGFCSHVCVDGSDNVYVFTGGRQILKITQARVISVVAGNFWAGEAVVDGTGTAAILAAQCFMACDSAGNIFLKEPYSRIRYVTTAGVVTTIYNSATNWAGGQMAVVGSDLYFSDSLNLGVIHKCTPAGVITDFATHPESWWPYVIQRDPSSGGHLVYQASPTDGDPYRATSYGRLSAAGVFTEIYRLNQETGYTAPMRLQDSLDGKALVEIKVKQVAGVRSSAFNSTGAFQMSGFGMCFEQLFGGAQ